MPASSAQEAARAARSPVVLLLATALFINYVDRGLLPTAAPLLQADLHINAAQLGVLLSAFFWTYAIIQVPVGWVAERFGAERVLAVGLALWATATILTGSASAFAVLIGLRLMLGLGESTGFPCTSKILSAVVPAEALGTANGIIGFAYLIGPAFGGFFGGLLIAHFGWRAGFWVFGALSLLWLWPWSRVVVTRQVVPAAPDSPSLFAILRQPALLGAGIGHFSANYTYYFMLTWLPYYLVNFRGFSNVEMAQLTGAAYLVTGFSALIAGRAIDWGIARGGSANTIHKAVMAAGHGGAMLCMLGMAVGARPVALSCIFLYQALVGASSPGVFAIPQILAGPAATGRWVGIQNAIGNMAGVVAPALTGFIIQATGLFTAAFVVAAAVSFAGLVGWVFVLPKIAPLRWAAAGRDSSSR